MTDGGPAGTRADDRLLTDRLLTDRDRCAPLLARVLVVGYGNTLRSDDGVGPAVATSLAGDPRLRGAEVRVEHQLAPELALDASRVDLVVLVDAAEGLRPGEVAIRRVEAAAHDAAGAPPMTHHLDPAALVGLSRELWGVEPRMVVVSIGIASTEVGEGLTPEVAASVARAADAVAEIVMDRARA